MVRRSGCDDCEEGGIPLCGKARCPVDEKSVYRESDAFSWGGSCFDFAMVIFPHCALQAYYNDRKRNMRMPTLDIDSLTIRLISGGTRHETNHVGRNRVGRPGRPGPSLSRHQLHP